MNIKYTPARGSALESVMEWWGFDNAHSKYLALVEVSLREGWELTDRFSGCTCTVELSETEAALFGLDAGNVPELCWAYERYENLIGSMDAYFGEFTGQEREDHAAFYLGERQWSFDKAVGFMTSACGLDASSVWGRSARSLPQTFAAVSTIEKLQRVLFQLLHQPEDGFLD